MAALSILCNNAGAQELSVSTNVADYARTGSANIEASYALARHWSVAAGVKYDPAGSDRQQLYSLGGRYWPWHIYSGWWFGARMKYQEFSRADAHNGPTTEGDRYGLGFIGGYSRMLSRHLNVDLGLGLWGGYSTFTSYACPVCGRVTGSGRRLFIMPDDVIVALSYIF